MYVSSCEYECKTLKDLLKVFTCDIRHQIFNGQVTAFSLAYGSLRGKENILDIHKAL